MNVLLRRCVVAAVCAALHMLPGVVSSSESQWFSNTNNMHLAPSVAISTRSKLECAVRCHNSHPCRSFAWEASSGTCYLQVEVDSGMTSSVYLPVYRKLGKYTFMFAKQNLI